MIPIHFTIDGQDVAAALRRAPQQVLGRAETALARGAQEVARAARAQAPKAFSTLVHAIRVERVGALHYRVDAHTRYAPMVELGTPPGYLPPMAALLPWIRLRAGGGSEASLRARARGLALAIRERGTRAQPFMRPAAEDQAGRVAELVRAAVAEGVRELLG